MTPETITLSKGFTLDDMYRWEGLLAQREAKRLWDALTQTGGIGALYLYFKPSTADTPGDILFVREEDSADDGWQCADPQAYRGNLTTEQATRRILQALKRLPILPYGV